MTVFHAGRTEDGAQGASRASLFPDNLADIAWRDTKAQDSYIIVGNGFHSDCGWIVYQGPNNFCHQNLHSRDSVLSQTSFQTLSHSFTSEEITRLTLGSDRLPR